MNLNINIRNCQSYVIDYILCIINMVYRILKQGGLIPRFSIFIFLSLHLLFEKFLKLPGGKRVDNVIGGCPAAAGLGNPVFCETQVVD